MAGLFSFQYRQNCRFPVALHCESNDPSPKDGNSLHQIFLIPILWSVSQLHRSRLANSCRTDRDMSFLLSSSLHCAALSGVVNNVETVRLGLILIQIWLKVVSAANGQ